MFAKKRLVLHLIWIAALVSGNAIAEAGFGGEGGGHNRGGSASNEGFGNREHGGEFGRRSFLGETDGTFWKHDLSQLERRSERSGIHPSRVLSSYHLREGLYDRKGNSDFMVAAFDKENGAKRPTDRQSKFVIIEDLSMVRSNQPKWVHLLAIPTPKVVKTRIQEERLVVPPAIYRAYQREEIGYFEMRSHAYYEKTDVWKDAYTAENIVWLHQVGKRGSSYASTQIAAKHVDHLGRMVRGLIDAAEKHPVFKLDRDNDVHIYINMPGAALAEPTLHMHGTLRDTQTKDWASFLQQNQSRTQKVDAALQGDFTVVRSAAGDHIAAIADAKYGGLDKISKSTDALIGKMLLAVYKAALDNAGNKPLIGQIIINKNGDNRIVVQAKKLGADRDEHGGLFRGRSERGGGSSFSFSDYF
ncbi:MAG: hypothetical protein H6707_01425 [Deltaproteobacteria bacterium]|nr:hypothetical protein [Deltaproteobacteria bacterium]